MGFLSSIFGGGDGGSSTPKPTEPKWQTDLRKRLALLAEPKAKQRIRRAGEPYTGQLPGTAELSGFEQTGLEGLGKYLESPLPTAGTTFGLAKGEMEKTLGGEEYDPVSGTYYQAYRNAVMRELQEAKDRLAASTSARDKYFGGGRIAAAGELEETAVGELEMILGQLFERERERRLGAVPEAMRMATFEEMMPLQRVEASQRFGALPRMQEEAGAEAEYTEYLRQLTDLGIPLDVAVGMATYRPSYYTEQPQQAGAGFGGIAQALAMLLAKKGA